MCLTSNGQPIASAKPSSCVRSPARGEDSTHTLGSWPGANVAGRAPTGCSLGALAGRRVERGRDDIISLGPEAVSGYLRDCHNADMAAGLPIANSLIVTDCNPSLPARCLTTP